MGEREIRVGSMWRRWKDGKLVTVVDAGRPGGFVRLLWPRSTGNGMIRARRTTSKRRHYFLREFQPATPDTEEPGP